MQEWKEQTGGRTMAGLGSGVPRYFFFMGCRGRAGSGIEESTKIIPTPQFSPRVPPSRRNFVHSLPCVLWENPGGEQSSHDHSLVGISLLLNRRLATEEDTRPTHVAWQTIYRVVALGNPTTCLKHRRDQLNQSTIIPGDG